MSGIDCFVHLESPAFRVLQLTDMQIIDAGQCRYEGRLNPHEMEIWATENLDVRCYNMIRTLVDAIKPAMIVITGDLVYDEFDDSGVIWNSFLDLMEGFGIPWAPVFGNHDRGSRIGIEYKCDSLEQAPHCLFRRGDTVGYGNYTVAAVCGGRVVRAFYMMDSGPHMTHGLCAEQLAWMYERAEAIRRECGFYPPSSCCFHIPPVQFQEAAARYDRQTRNGAHPGVFTIHEDVEGDPGDFGSQREDIGAIKGIYIPPQYGSMTFTDLLHHCGVDSVFAGHSHCVNTSIFHDGIRWTMGLKTGEYDRFTPGELGGTVLEVAENGISVFHRYVT